MRLIDVALVVPQDSGWYQISDPVAESVAREFHLARKPSTAKWLVRWESFSIKLAPLITEMPRSVFLNSTAFASALWS